jgi:LysR family transcriptional regulator, regulator for bpeEF and oprC
MTIHKLRGLEYLVAVVDCGGFNAAARRMGVATPSLHRLVKALEAELGTALLDRSSRPVRPNPDAVAYVDRARVLLAELRELDASVQDSARAPSGTIRVAAQSVALQFVLAGLLPRFHTRHPEVQVEMVDAGNSRDLVHLGVDALVQFGWPPPQDAILRTLAETRWLIVAAPSYWARHGLPRHPRDLGGHPCALFQTPFGEVLRQWSFQRGQERMTVEVDGWLVSDSRTVLDAPLYAGQLVGRINDLSAHPGITDGRLQPVLLDWTGLNSPPLSLLVKRSLARQPRMRAWVEFLVDHAQQLTAARLPAGLPPVQPSERPDWWRKHVPSQGRTRAAARATR